jgi:hypothetical protein
MPSRLFSQARSIQLRVAIIAACGLAACVARSDLPLTQIASPAITLRSISTPTIAPTPTIECSNDAKFISDLSVPDGTHLRPGTVFTKTWQVRNTGNCAWTIDHQLKFIGGAPLNTVSVNLPQSVIVSATLDLSIVLTAPTTAGNYNVRWRLFAADGAPFGPTLFAEINVP